MILKIMKLGKEKLDNVKFLPLNIFLLNQKKIILMDRFKSFPAVEKVPFGFDEEGSDVDIQMQASSNDP